jgi:hypothetical protein
MREILLRGKRKDNREWVCGGFALDAIGCPRITVKDGNGLLFHEVVPETVVQYTGRIDRKGVKIFEGDFVVYWNTVYTVEYSKSGGAFEMFNFANALRVLSAQYLI